MAPPTKISKEPNGKERWPTEITTRQASPPHAALLSYPPPRAPPPSSFFIPSHYVKWYTPAQILLCVAQILRSLLYGRHNGVQLRQLRSGRARDGRHVLRGALRPVQQVPQLPDAAGIHRGSRRRRVRAAVWDLVFVELFFTLCSQNLGGGVKKKLGRRLEFQGSKEPPQRYCATAAVSRV